MSDREILTKYINLNNTVLTEDVKEDIMNMLFKYKEAFNLRDKIGTCPNIEVGIDVTDKLHHFSSDHLTLGKDIRKSQTEK